MFEFATMPGVCSYFIGPPVGAKGCVRGIFGVTESVRGVLSPGDAKSLASHLRHLYLYR